MNPNSLFGSSQGGAFQAPNNTNKPGLFQPFGQQSNSSQPQNIGFFQSPTFGQPSILNQTPGNGSNIFGQTPAFGQTSVFGQSPGQPSTISQAPAFGQQVVGQSNPGFTSSTTPAFGQPSGSGQSWMLGQTPAFGQSSTFGQAPGFSQQTAGFGPSSASGPTITLGSTQPIGFGQSAFCQPSTSVTSSTFSTVQNAAQGKGFGSTEFSFKPSNEVLFKPIFSASPEPTNPQTTPATTQSSGLSQSTPSTMESSSTTTTTGFALFTGAKSGPLGFSFSQPTAAPSISAHKEPLNTENGSDSTSALKFTFSQPAAPSSTTITTTTAQPTTPSSFSFSAKVLQPEKASLFGGSSFGQTSAFGDPKAKTDPGTDEGGAEQCSTLETNVFARLGKGTKRKEYLAAPPAASTEKPVKEDKVPTGTDAPRHPSKRPLLRSRGPPGGLFGRAMSGLLKNTASTGRREESEPQVSEWREGEKADSPALGAPHAVTPPRAQASTPPRAQAPIREVLEKAEDSDAAKTPEPEPECDTATPARRSLRSESSGSGSGTSPTDGIAIQCKNVPPALNKKEVIEKHFGHFGKVRRVFCRPNKNMAIVHFHDHASALKAKKKGKVLHRHQLQLFWQKKRQSSGEKGPRCLAEEPKPGSSPLRRPQLRASTLSSSESHSPPVKMSLQFESDPQQEAEGQSQSLGRPMPSSLLHLIGQTAETAEEKYRLLEQRDKIMRQGRPKRTDMDLSNVFVGTCPDMCPEKERYMRDTRNQLSSFELLQDSEMVDHRAAIKEYSRSSADQEEPLPHELRPLPVLSMTMDYLLTQVMDQGLNNYRDWYDFVWNRTRGIRKDITQQHLCCPQTVSLIEKCARFHVHCAHHLCEEPMMAFEPKINDENLTKCLQSLKEMYEDLGTRQVYCPHEAEFRQYNVLLQLNNGDILREVQQFRDEVRNSPEVKFAVQASAALNINNVVRFFKLVKSASYLAGCILHRYFNQVRSMALRTLNIAYTVGNQRSTAFPVEDLRRMLMFRDADETVDFVQQYGLTVSDGIVELSRMAYQEPDLSPTLTRSEVIMKKRSVLIGEVVSGGALPNPPQHDPVCSFDSQNKYRGEGPMSEPSAATGTTTFHQVAGALPDVEDQPQVSPARLFGEQPASSILPATAPASTGESGDAGHASLPTDSQQLFQPVFQPQPIKAPSPLPPPPPPPKPQYSDEDILAVLENVVEEVVDTGVRDVANAGASYAKFALVESGVQAEALLAEVVGHMMHEVSSAEIQLETVCVAEEKRKLEEARRRQEHETFVLQFSFDLCAEVLQEVLSESIQQTATAEIQEAQRKQRELEARCTEQVCTSLVEETLEGEIALLVQDHVEAELQLIRKYIKRWRDVVTGRRQLKRQMRGFPAAPCGVDPRFKLQALAPSAPERPSMLDLARGVVNLGNAGNVALSSTRLLKMRQEAVHRMRVHYYYQRLLDETAWEPLDLPTLVTANIPDPPDRIFWKAALLLPSDHESVASQADRILSDWLEVKLGGREGSEVKEKQPEGMLQTLCVSNTLQENRERAHKVHVSIKVSRGPLSDEGLSKMEECHELQGAGALLLLLPVPPGPAAEQDDQDVPLLSALLQLKQVQQAYPWHSPLPLALLVPGPDHGTGDARRLEEALMLRALVEEGLISEYTFYHLPESTSDLLASQQLIQAVHWLVARAPAPCALSCRTLLHFVESGVSRQFSHRLCSERQERRSAGLPSHEPAAVVGLYNAVLAHLADAVSSPELLGLSWPPGEFSLPDTRNLVPRMGWNSAEHLAWLRDAVLSLRLPEWETPSTAADWSQLCSAVLHYGSQIPASRGGWPLLMSQLENLMERVRRRHQHHQHRPGPRRRRAEERRAPSYHQVPWDDLLMLCIGHKLQDWQSSSPPVCEDVMTEDGQVLVYFLTESLNGFRAPEEWRQAVRLTHRQKQLEPEGDVPPSTLGLRQRLFQSLAEPPLPLSPSLPVTHHPSAQEPRLPLAQEPQLLRLLQSLAEEKAEGQRCIEQMKLRANPCPAIPSSTLLTCPSAVVPSSRAMPQRSPLKQEVKPADPEPGSMAWLWKELKHEQERERVARQRLSDLMSKSL